jgi:hypothetical protein
MHTCWFIDCATLYDLMEKEIEVLQLLFSSRSRSVKSKVSLEVAANEIHQHKLLLCIQFA